MQRMEPREFGRRTVDGRPCGHYEFSLYYGLEFECACGRVHQFKPWMEILSELPLFRFVVACPDGRHLTVLTARWNREGAERALMTSFLPPSPRGDGPYSLPRRIFDRAPVWTRQSCPI